MLRLSLFIALLLSQNLACSTSPFYSKSNDSDSVIGKPPPTDNDPFAVISLPADATPVAHQGTLESDDTGHVSVDKTLPVAAEAYPTIPPAVASDNIPEPGQDACFSCVQICTTEDTSADCSDAPQDLICGWGTAPDLEHAKDMARAHCTSTLDMARSMPMYSRIEGDCPPASCR